MTRAIRRDNEEKLWTDDQMIKRVKWMKRSNVCCGIEMKTENWSKYLCVCRLYLFWTHWMWRGWGERTALDGNDCFGECISKRNFRLYEIEYTRWIFNERMRRKKNENEKSKIGNCCFVFMFSKHFSST